MILLKSIPKIDKFINNKAFDGFSKELITKISKKNYRKFTKRYIRKQDRFNK